VADDWPVPRLADLEHDIRLAADMDTLLADRERSRSVWRRVEVVADRRLDEHILGIRAGGREGPSNMRIAPHHDTRHARCRGPRPRALGPLDADQIPRPGQ